MGIPSVCCIHKWQHMMHLLDIFLIQIDGSMITKTKQRIDESVFCSLRLPWALRPYCPWALGAVLGFL